MSNNQRVAYFYDGKLLVFRQCDGFVMRLRFRSESMSLIYSCCLGQIGNYYYGQGHPMKPHRYVFNGVQTTRTALLAPRSALLAQRALSVSIRLRAWLTLNFVGFA